MKAVFYEAEEMGAKFHEADIPAEYVEKARKYRARMIEAAAEYDEELMDDLRQRSAGRARRRSAGRIRKGTLAQQAPPGVRRARR